jgi:hypothetical protein
MVTLTRRGLLARAGRLAPLAAAAGMLGRFAVPVVQPVEQAALPDAVPMQEAMVGWLEAEPVYNYAQVAWNESGDWVTRLPWAPWRVASTFHPRSLLVWLQDGTMARWEANNELTILKNALVRFVPTIPIG